MSYQGDIRLGKTIEWTFTTRRFSTGVPFTLAGTPSLEAYETGNTTPITAGITLTVDYSGVTGLNHVSIAVTGGNGFAAQTDVSVVIAAGTVDSVSVVGETIGAFSIENRSAVMPTTADRTLTIENDGMAHADLKEWLGVAPLALTSQLVQVSVGAMQAAVITAASIAANAFAAAKFAADYWTSLITSVWTDAATRTLTAFGFSVTVGTNNDKTGYAIGVGGITATSFDAGAVDAAAVAQDAAQEIADEVLNRNLAGGGSGNTRNVRNALRALRNRVADDGAGTATIYQEDDATPAWTAATTRNAALEPLQEVDPSGP